MLYHLLYPLHAWVGAFNVFRYITFRTALAALTAMVVSFVLGPWLIRRLRAYQVGQQIRPEGPQSHHSKAGTPTMGGLLIILAVSASSLLWMELGSRFLWLALLTFVAFGAIGFLDDAIKLGRGRSLGLTVRRKLALQVAAGTLVGLALLGLAGQGHYDTQLNMPFLKGLTPELGWLYLPLAVLVIVGAANAVNFTDGLDGLAIGSVLIASGTFVILTYVTGHKTIADYLDIIHMRGSAELTIFCGALVGAALGFLWFNSHPAEVFMGDSGSNALGAAIGVVALLSKQELLLVLVGGLFVAEALSVIVQVASYRWRGKRVFLMAPLHHHFELKGWPESKVIIRFWILALICALLSLSTLKLR